MQQIEDYFKEIMKEPILDISKEYTYEYKGDEVTLYLNKNKVLRAKYSVIGIYVKVIQVFYWAYSVALIDRSVADKSKIVTEEFGTKIKKKIRFDTPDLETLYYYGTNTHFMAQQNNIMTPVKMMLYATKAKIYLMDQSTDTNQLKFIAIDSIIETY